MMGKVLVLFLFLFSFQQAHTNEAAYQFKATETKPEFDKSFKFSTEKETTQPTQDADPIKNAEENESKHLYKIPFGYPRKEFYFSYNPGYYGFRYELTSVKTYSIVSSNTQDLTLGFRYSPNTEYYFNLELRTFTFSIPDFNDTGAGLIFKKSSATPLSISFSAPFKCTIYEVSTHRFCVGMAGNIDSFPTLEFVTGSNTNLQVNSVRDITLGGFIDYKKPLFGQTILVANAGIHFGFGLGQAETLGTKNNQRISGAVGTEWPMYNFYFNLMGGLDYRLAQMKSSLDEWKISNGSYYGRLGMRWEFGP